MTQKTINFARVLLELGMDGSKLQEVRQIFADNPLLVDALICPVVSKKEKLQVVDRVFEGEIKNFLKVLCENDGIDELFEILDCYEKMKLEADNVLCATLVYVTPPDAEQKKKIEDFLCKKYNRTSVRLDMVKDESLLGGFVIKTMDREYDWSLAGRHRMMTQKLVMR